MGSLAGGFLGFSMGYSVGLLTKNYWTIIITTPMGAAIGEEKTRRPIKNISYPETPMAK